MKLYYLINEWNGKKYFNYMLVLDSGKKVMIKSAFKNDNALINLIALKEIEEYKIDSSLIKKDSKKGE